MSELPDSENSNQVAPDLPMNREDLLLISSAQLDGELSEAEERQLQQSVADKFPSEVVDRFSRDARRLGDLLRSLPIRPAGSRIPNAVAAARQMPQVQPEQQVARQKVVLQKKPGVRRWLTGVSGVLMAAVMLFFVMRTADFPKTDQRTASNPVPGMISTPLAKQEQSNKSDEMSPEMEVHVAGDNWQILSLRISATDRDEALSQVRLLASSIGLEMQPLSDYSSSGDGDGFGILLTSAPAEQQAFLDRVTKSDLIRSSEWDPSQIAHMDRRTLISAVQESMLNPTQSELHFGEVFVAVHHGADTEMEAGADLIAASVGGRGQPPENLSESPSSDADLPGVADAPSRARMVLPTAETADSAMSARKIASRGSLKTLSNRPVFVVFELEQSPSTGRSGL